MERRDSGIARRAWDVLRLALLCARRGGVFRRLLAVKFRVAVTRFLKSIGGGRCGYSSSMPQGRIHYGERQLSFEETPIFRVKMHRPRGSMRSHFCLPRIPCISPDVDFNDGFGDDEDSGECDWERKILVADGDRGECVYDERASESSEEEGIDERAEEFIAKFYEQMRLQRQISYLQYTEMLNKATS
ncbi:uncharacterized protein LOC115742478 [Rhodamnia argentea]|uniref:Uncharacterized protein LOC115742478 n=1 Tax=Rhodamnia argentea TaxID=178133 RepID=A0A8B8PDJ3_9MYRT|nr:uncharacterized protein LOC115742478 [Rhodamnia argentea]